MVITERGIRIVFILANLLGLWLFFYDKSLAKNQVGHRIKETVLWRVALFGGAVGALIGMRLFRHKTQKGFFHIGILLLALLQMVLVVYLLTKFG